MSAEPGPGSPPHPPTLLGADGTKRPPVRVARALFDLDENDRLSPSQNEVELVTRRDHVGVEEPIAAEQVMPASNPLTMVHAASAVFA